MYEQIDGVNKKIINDRIDNFKDKKIMKNYIKYRINLKNLKNVNFELYPNHNYDFSFYDMSRTYLPGQLTMKQVVNHSTQ